MGKKNKKLYFESISFLLYGLLSFIWLWMHEPWRDEAQAWLIVRDLDIVGIIKQMVWEGSPALWQLLLYPLVKSGLPYISMFILHWFIAILSAWLLLYKLHLSKLLKIGLLFSYYLFFEYVLVARNYNISILLLFLIVSVYQDRHKKPILFSIFILLLFNTNIHCFGAALALMLIYIWEVINTKKDKLKNIIAILIMILGILLVLIQIAPAGSMQQNAIVEKSVFNFNSVFLALNNSFLPNFNLNIFYGIIFVIVLLLFFFRFSIRPKIFIFLFVSVSWLIYIFGFVHAGGLRHHGFILIFIIVSLLLEQYYEIEQLTISGKKYRFKIMHQLSFYILILCFSLSIYKSIEVYHKELKFNYSGSKEAATFMKNNIQADQDIIVHRSYACSALLPYLPDHKFWYADREDFGTFMIWDDKFKNNAYDLSNQKVVERVEKRFGKEENKIFLLTNSLSAPSLNGLELLFSTRKKVFCKEDEQFYIYQEKHEK